MNESELIAASQKGQLGAFNHLVLAYQQMVYNTAYRLLGDRDAAADASQEAFLAAFQAIKSFRGGSFRAWLLRIVTNACYDQLRAKKRRPTTSLDALLVDASENSYPSRMVSPDNHVMRRELQAELQRGLLSLPEEQRLVVILSDVQGLSYEEIATATNTNLGTVKSRLSRARAKLRDFLLDQEELLPGRYRLINKDDLAE